MTSNLRFPHVFVYDPGTTPLLLDDTKKPSDLLANQVGIFNADTGLGVTQAQAATVPRIFIAQKLGDNKYGAKRTETIDRTKLAPQPGGYYGSNVVNGVEQVSHIGYAETGVYTSPTNDTRAGLRVLRTNEDVVITILLYYRPLATWYSVVPYTHTIVIPKADVAASAEDELYYDEVALATKIKEHINAEIGLIDGFAETHELAEYLTATVVTNGDGAAGGPVRAGVKIVANAVAPDAINANDPQKGYEAKLITFEVVKRLDFGELTVTKTTSAVYPQGFPLQIANSEYESQGYDGHTRGEMFSNPKFQAKVPYVINAKEGKKYDSFFLGYTFTHDSGVYGATSGLITEKYLTQISVEENEGAALQTFLNAWVAPVGYAALSISA